MDFEANIPFDSIFYAFERQSVFTYTVLLLTLLPAVWVITTAMRARRSGELTQSIPRLRLLCLLPLMPAAAGSYLLFQSITEKLVHMGIDSDWSAVGDASQGRLYLAVALLSGACAVTFLQVLSYVSSQREVKVA